MSQIIITSKGEIKRKIKSAVIFPPSRGTTTVAKVIMAFYKEKGLKLKWINY